jgi:uncharacterized protein (TIRG00374 family)
MSGGARDRRRRILPRDGLGQLLGCSTDGRLRPWQFEEHRLVQASFAPFGVKRRVLMILAAVVAVGYLGVGFALDGPRVRHATAQLGWGGCSLVLALSLLNYLLRFGRWQLLIGRLGHRLPFTQHLLCYLSGFALTISPAKAGEALRGVYLREHGVGYSQSVGALFVERLLDLLAMIVLASLILALLPAYRPLVLGVLAAALLLLAAVGSGMASRWVDARHRLLRGAIAARLLAALSNLLRSAAALLEPELLFAGIAIGIVSWGCEGLGFFLICQSMHIGVRVLSAIGIYALGILAGSAAFFLPAGIGGTELAMSALLVGAGTGVRDAVIATLLCRVATLWFAVLIGIASAGALELAVPLQRWRTAPP